MDKVQTELRYAQKKAVSLEESLQTIQQKYQKVKEVALGAIYGLNTRAPTFRDNAELMINILGASRLQQNNGSSICEYSPNQQLQVMALLRLKFLSPEHFSTLFRQQEESKSSFPGLTETLKVGTNFQDINNEVPFIKDVDSNALLKQVAPEFE